MLCPGKSHIDVLSAQCPVKGCLRFSRPASALVNGLGRAQSCKLRVVVAASAATLSLPAMAERELPADIIKKVSTVVILQESYAVRMHGVRNTLVLAA